MLYGRLDENNVVVEIIDQDPTGRYAAEIEWVTIHEDFGLLTTKSKNELLKEIAIVQEVSFKAQRDQISNSIQSNKIIKNELDQIRNELEANGVDVAEVYRLSLTTQAEQGLAAEETPENDAEDAAEETPTE